MSFPSNKPLVSRAPSKRVDGWILGFLLLSFTGALFLFGGVRLWSFGPLALIGCLSFLFFWFRRSYSIPILRIPPGGIFLALFGVYAFLQTATAVVPWDARVKALLISASAAALFVWTQLGGRRNRWKVLFGAVLLLITLVAWYALIQHVHGARGVLTLIRPEGYEMRASGTFMCPNHFANLVAMGMCLALSLLLTPEAGWSLKLIAGYSFLLFGYPLILTQSRSGLLGVGAGLGTLLLLTAYRRSRRLFWIACLVVPLLLGVAGWGVFRYGPHMRERVALAVSGLKTGNDMRLICWRETVEMIRQRPVLGWGGGSYRWVEPLFQKYHWGSTVLYAHNEYLQLQAEYGGVGAGLMLAFAGTAGVRLTRRAVRSPRLRNSSLAAGAVSVLVCSAVHALFDFNFHIFANSQFLLLVLGLVSACLFEDEEWKPRPLPGRWAPLLRVASLVVALFLALGLVQVLASYGLGFPAKAARVAEAYDRSDRLYRQAIRIDPGAWEPRMGLARLLKTRAYLLVTPKSRPDWLDESLLRYEEALARNPYEMEILYGMSHLHEMRGDPEKALESLKEMVRLRPDFPFYRSRMAVQLYRMGRLEEAQSEFEQVLRIDSGDEAARLHLPKILETLQSAQPMT